MNGERLELVTGFADLREGMIVVITGCGWCAGGNRSHRGILLPGNGLPVSGPSGTKHEPHFTLSPVPRCMVGHIPGAGQPAVVRQDVVEKRVYRVVDGLSDSSAESTAKKRERVR